MLKKTLIKYVDGDSIGDRDCFKAIYTDTPFELLRVVEQAKYIEVNNDYYRYASSTYQVPETEENMDCIVVYLDLVV